MPRTGFISLTMLLSASVSSVTLAGELVPLVRARAKSPPQNSDQNETASHNSSGDAAREGAVIPFKRIQRSTNPVSQHFGQDPDAEFLDEMETLKNAAKSTENFARDPSGLDRLTQNQVSGYLNYIASMESDLHYLSNLRGTSPTADQAAAEVAAAYKRALDAVHSSGIIQRLEAAGFDTKVVPQMLLKKDLPAEVIQRIELTRLSNVAVELSKGLILFPGVNKLRRRIGLPAGKKYLKDLSRSLDLTIETISIVRNELLKGRYDLEQVDDLIKETDDIVSDSGTTERLRDLSRSLLPADRRFAAELSEKIKRVKIVMGAAQGRGQLKIQDQPIQSTEVRKPRVQRDMQLFEDLLHGTPEVQEERYRFYLDSGGQPKDEFMKFLFQYGAYDEDLTSEELRTILTRLLQRCKVPCRATLPGLLRVAYRSLNHPSLTERSLVIPRAGVANQKVAAILDRIGDQESYELLELMEAESPFIIGKLPIYAEAPRDLYRENLKSMLESMRERNPEFRPGLSPGRRRAICVWSALRGILP